MKNAIYEYMTSAAAAAPLRVPLAAAVVRLAPLCGGRMGATHERAERIKAVRLVLNSVSAAAAVN